MKKLFLLIIAMFFVSGCVINSDDQIFAKKKECATLKADIEKHLEDLNNETSVRWLNKIFYSPKRNTCMYTAEGSLTADNVIRRTYYLYDAFTNDLLVSEFGCLPKDNCEKELMQASRDFDKLVEQYE